MYSLLISFALALFFLLALTRPRYAITLLAGLLPTYLLRFTIAGIPTNLFEVAVWLALLASLLHPGWLRFPRVTGYWSLVTFFTIAAIFSTLITPTLHSLGILKSWILTPIVFAWLVRRKLEVVNALIASGVIVSVIGLFQLGSLERITSIYDVPNSLALFIAPLIILALFRGGCLHYLAGLIMFAALLGTQSLAGLAAVFIVLFLSRLFPGLRITDYGLRIPGYWLLVTGFLFSLLFLTFTGRLAYFFQPVFNSALHTSLTVRQQLWSISWDLVKEHPLRGLGLGQFELAYQQKLHERFQKFSSPAGYGLLVTGPLPEFVFRDPHNWLLALWLNTGLLGLLSFTALNLLALKPLLHPSSLPITHYSLLLSLLCLLLFGLVDTIYWKNDLAALHWLLLGLLLRLMKYR